MVIATFSSADTSATIRATVNGDAARKVIATRETGRGGARRERRRFGRRSATRATHGPPTPRPKPPPTPPPAKPTAARGRSVIGTLAEAVQQRSV